MTTPSLTETIGLYFSAFDPYWFIGPTVGGDITTSRITTLDYGLNSKINSYTHSKQADGGDMMASLTFNADISLADDWLCNGLGRRITVYNRAGLPCFAGIVNLITINTGSITRSRGPLLDIGNRVSVIYTPVFISDDSVVNGVTTITTIEENFDSQERYGIIEKVLSAGSVVEADAYMLRDQFLKDNSMPVTYTTITTGNAGNTAVVLDIVGLVQFLGAYIYENYGINFVSASEKIRQIFSLEPNDIFDREAIGSSLLHNIDENPYLLPEVEIQNRYALNIIKEIASLGDASDNRWIYGVDSNRQFYYKQVVEEINYALYVTDNVQSVMHIQTKNIVYPYDLEPGKFILLSDTNTAGVNPEDLLGSPYSFFIESVNYTAPNMVVVNSGRLNKTDQLIAKLTMSGGY